MQNGHHSNGTQRGRYDRKNNRYICPAGRTLRQTGTSVWINHKNFRRYVAKKSDCSVCPLRDRCLANARVKRRNLHLINRGEPTFASRMAAKIDTPRGKKLYSQRMGIIEPVFANVTFQKGLNRFTLRGRRKVNAQWKLFNLVHNIEKIANYGNLRRLG